MKMFMFIIKTILATIVGLFTIFLLITLVFFQDDIKEGVRQGKASREVQASRRELVAEVKKLQEEIDSTEPNTGISGATTTDDTVDVQDDVDVQDEVEPPTEAAIKKARTAALTRCKTTYKEYGNAMVKLCVDADMRAFSSLWDYPQESKEAVNLCYKKFSDYGLSMVKMCVDSEMKATNELAEIEAKK
ncbi:MAG: hypothetical protein ACREVA_06915 [Burkholderiales bacterium]